ncbi:MAG: flagellar protein FliL [Candidatus Petromonas sp.]|jgi:flagellar FliL protein|nr:flagellar protein FliL [Candidatus Petromonas sp.]
MTVKKVLILSLIGLIIATLIITGIIFFVLNSDGKNKDKKLTYYEYNLEEIYTNIKSSKSILKANITIEYTDDKLKAVLDNNKAKITNDILELLRNKTLKDLSGQEGQQKTRNDILNKVRGILNTKDISNIYFTEFIIQ